MNKKQFCIIICMILVFCVGCTKKSDLIMEQGMLQELEVETSAQEKESEVEFSQIDTGTELEGAETAPQKEAAGMYVHICGAIQKPGVYRMETGDRIFQVIEAAGGFALNAQESYVNQSKRLEDGMKIWIPTFQELQESGLDDMQNEEAGIDSINGEQADSNSAKINLNTASESELCTLAGVGASKAKSIIAYREKNGKFQKIEEIMKIEGIKEGSFEKLKDQITVQ